MYQAICITCNNKKIKKPQSSEADAWLIADEHAYDNPGCETTVRRVIQGSVQLSQTFRNLEEGSKGKILSGPFGEREVYHVKFENDNQVSFRKVPLEKLE